MRIKDRLLLFFLIFLPAAGWAQDSLMKQFESYRKQSYQEKMLVQIDRNFHLTGETLWFDIKMIDAALHQPASLSSVAYIEIKDRSGQVALKAKVLLKDGRGTGSLFLPAQLSSGNYLFRAYTQWMKNCGAACYFETFITIVNPFIRLESVSRAAAEDWNAEFFPEGGALVDGVHGRIAFLVRTRAGKGIRFKGCILDERNDTVASFLPKRFGMGDFSFTPRSNKKYRACIRVMGGAPRYFQLPVVQESGYALSIDDTGQFLKIEVRTKNVSDETPLRLFAQSRLRVSYSETRSLRDGITTFAVSKEQLAEGVTQFTLFDPGRKAVCERLYFKYPRKDMPVEVKTETDVTGVRKKVTLQIKSSAKTLLTVAVSRIDSMEYAWQGNLISQLWLGSDVGRNIECPDYYFNEGRQDPRLIDNLMLTQQWTRIRWDDVFSTKSVPPRYLPEPRGHVVQGRVTKPNGEPAALVQIFLTSPGSDVRLYECRSNRDGIVQFEVKNLFGRKEVFAQTDLRQDTTSRVEILDPVSHEPARDSVPVFWLSPELDSQILARCIAMQVQDIYNRKFSGQFDNPVPDSLAFYGRPDETYFLDDYTRFPVMEEVLGEYVPGVFVRRRKGKVHFMVLDRVRGGVFREDPLILLDGLPIFKTEQLLSFDPLKIKRLEVVTRKYYLGGARFPGIVSYSTYGRDLAGFQPDSRVVRTEYDGPQPPYKFTAPSYSDVTQQQSRVPDQRTMLYWNSAVTTDDSGDQKIEFYTSDLPGKYRVVVSGISSQGSPGEAALTFTVTAQ